MLRDSSSLIMECYHFKTVNPHSYHINQVCLFDCKQLRKKYLLLNLLHWGFEFHNLVKAFSVILINCMIISLFLNQYNEFHPLQSTTNQHDVFKVVGFAHFHLFAKWTVEVKSFKNISIVKINRYLTLLRTNNAADDFVTGVRRALQGSTLVGDRMKQCAVCGPFSTVKVLRKFVHTNIFRCTYVI